MIKKNKFFLLIFFFLIFTTYNSNKQKENFSIFFPIKKIKIENTSTLDPVELKNKLEFLRYTSLFFLKKDQIIDVTNKYDFISSIQIKKKYPNILIISVYEEKPIATEIIDKKRYYLTEKGKKIDFIEIKSLKNLPVIFGNHNNFSSFFNELKKNNFKIDSIKAFYYFDVGRWDIVLRNGKTIKLPQTNYESILMKIESILNNSSFSKYTVFDYRIKNQLILK
tara:strand:- start:35 stop:703 length:669 start_codon:yes stop_codon:yes gene_type:complete